MHIRKFKYVNQELELQLVQAFIFIGLRGFFSLDW